jgi:hypothetical protein
MHVVAKEPRQRVVHGRRTGPHASTDGPKELAATALLRKRLFGITAQGLINQVIPYRLLGIKGQAGIPLTPLLRRTAATGLFVKVTDEVKVMLFHFKLRLLGPRLDLLSLSK